jgi:hypothetical protein
MGHELDRDPISDCLAIAAMPDIEKFAAKIDEEAPARRKLRRDNRSIVIFAGAARAFGSQSSAHSAMTRGGLWERMRESAATVGRDLPAEPPTPDQVCHLLRAHDHLPAALEPVLNETAMTLAQSMGLFDPDRPFEWRHPDRRHHLTGDGTVLKPLSGVTEANKLERSRASDPERDARVCEAFRGKPPQDASEDTRTLGLPFAVVSTHSGLRHQRVVFGLQVYRDSNEIGAAMDIFDRVLPLAEGGVHTVNYDMLMRDTHVSELLRRHGAMAIVPVPQASQKQRGLDVPVDHPRYQRGRGGVKRPKGRMSAKRLGAYEHQGGDGVTCWHQLWLVDGEARLTGFGERELPDIDSPALTLVDLRRERRSEGYQVGATYRVPCPRWGDHEIEVDVTKPARGQDNDGAALNRFTVGKLRLLHERDEAFWDVAGRRSDSESTIDMIQRTLVLRQRATRLDIDRLLWDLIGAALLINARCWDTHVSQHTRRLAEAARQGQVQEVRS